MKITQQKIKDSGWAIDSFPLRAFFNDREERLIRDNIQTIMQWCTEEFGRFGQRWAIGTTGKVNGYFHSEADATAFALRWLC